MGSSTLKRLVQSDRNRPAHLTRCPGHPGHPGEPCHSSCLPIYSIGRSRSPAQGQLPACPGCPRPRVPRASPLHASPATSTAIKALRDPAGVRRVMAAAAAPPWQRGGGARRRRRLLAAALLLATVRLLARGPCAMHAIQHLKYTIIRSCIASLFLASLGAAAVPPGVPWPSFNECSQVPCAAECWPRTRQAKHPQCMVLSSLPPSFPLHLLGSQVLTSGHALGEDLQAVKGAPEGQAPADSSLSGAG